MNRCVLFPAAYIVDHIAGDPEWFPHPVRLIGLAISHGESRLNRPRQSSKSAFVSGAALTITVIGSAYSLTAGILRLARMHSESFGDTVELLLAWTCLAARNLEQEATAVTDALEAGNIPLSRKRLSRIVGRDTANLHAADISRAVIETVAESASDGVIAPLFYLALGGVPLAMAYKAVNTLDSMIGHADSRYFYFGKAAARIDDVSNYLPSRITALALVLASTLVPYADGQAAWRTWKRDGRKHKSPNAGQPESAVAGALHVALGGNNTYVGELIQSQRIGEENPAPTVLKARHAIRLVSVASIVALSVGTMLTVLIQGKRRKPL
jgi:adenosylcobinamide-phosphate synthase